tara:strand:- start:124 stop:414 length:291 start_codon:yes stop_codon:yes gene_type:complete
MKFLQFIVLFLTVLGIGKSNTVFCNQQGVCSESDFRKLVKYQMNTNQTFKNQVLKSLHASDEWILVPETSGTYYFHNKVSRIDQRELPLDLINFDF